MEGLFTKRGAAPLLPLIKALRGISPSCLVLPFSVFLCASAASHSQVLTQGANPRVCARLSARLSQSGEETEPSRALGSTV